MTLVAGVEGGAVVGHGEDLYRAMLDLERQVHTVPPTWVVRDPATGDHWRYEAGGDGARWANYEPIQAVRVP